MIDLRDPDDVAYAKDLGQLFFMALAAVWLVHSLFKGNANEVKRAVGSA